MKTYRAWFLVCVLLLLRCSGTQIDPGQTPDGGGVSKPVQSIRLVPGNQVLQVDLNQEGALDFQVQATFTDGTTADITAASRLTSESPSAGRLTGGRFTAPRSATAKVDFTTITATFEQGSERFAALAKLTVVWLRVSGPAQDFFFVLPYSPPTGTVQQKPLSFGTQIQSIDSFFAVDTTTSMTGAINELRGSLRNTILPGVSAAAPKGAWFGVGAVEDFPVDPYGNPNLRAGDPDDQPFVLLSPMSADVAVAQGAVDRLLVDAKPRGRGGDLPEAQLEALYQVATGSGNVVSGVVNVPAHQGKGSGGVELRSGAFPVVTLITDAVFHSKGEPARSCDVKTLAGPTVSAPISYSGNVATAAHSRTEAQDALNRLCAKVVGVSVLRTHIDGYQDQAEGICNATADLTQLAVATGAVVPPQAWDLQGRPAGCAAGRCCTGLLGAGEAPGADGLCPLVFKLPQDGVGLGAQVTSAIAQLARFSSFSVVVSTSGGATGDGGEALPAGKTTADLIKAVRPLDATAPPAPPVIPAPVVSGERFTNVTPGSVVRFSVEARNDVQPQRDRPQIFRATIRIRAGGCTDLDEREVLMLIPPLDPVLG